MTALLAAIIVWLLASITAGSNGLTQLNALERARETLGTEIVGINDRIAAVERTRTQLATDDSYLERLAREELGLVYPDEVVYRFRTGAGEPAP